MRRAPDPKVGAFEADPQSGDFEPPSTTEFEQGQLETQPQASASRYESHGHSAFNIKIMDFGSGSRVVWGVSGSGEYPSNLSFAIDEVKSVGAEHTLGRKGSIDVGS